MKSQKQFWRRIWRVIVCCRKRINLQWKMKGGTSFEEIMILGGWGGHPETISQRGVVPPYLPAIWSASWKRRCWMHKQNDFLYLFWIYLPMKHLWILKAGSHTWEQVIYMFGGGSQVISTKALMQTMTSIATWSWFMCFLSLPSFMVEVEGLDVLPF